MHSRPMSTLRIKWYWARTLDMPAMIRYLDHWATAVLTLMQELSTKGLRAAARDLFILSLGQVKGRTPELELSSPNYHAMPTREL
ncbi:hypothetical protein TNCV_2653621 [Trichonephila clavipes]|nr:hypothetical protein TNCV_2653621 [Trichonephila clavipes]